MPGHHTAACSWRGWGREQDGFTVGIATGIGYYSTQVQVHGDAAQEVLEIGSLL